MAEDTQGLDPEYQDTENGESEGSEGSEGNNFDKRYKDLQSWTTKVSQENKSLKSELDQLKGMVSAMQTQNSTPVQRQQVADWLEEIDAVDFIDEPNNLKDSFARMRAEMVELHRLQNAAFDEKLKEINPKTLKSKKLVDTYREEIDSMREENPDMFADIPDVALATTLSKLKPKEEESLAVLPRIGGGKTPRGAQASTEEKQIAAMMAKMGYTKEHGFN